MRRAVPLLLLALLLAPPARGDTEAIVGLDSGPISGVVTDGVAVYRGIPYAAPPVGDLRWRPPQAVAPWEEPRACLEFGPGSPQPGGFGKVGGFTGEQSEDCLYLNVFAPDPGPDEPLPVLVWIHGGGFVIGSASLPFYDGRHLAARGAVVVTINYRLGPFGFFGHPALLEESERKVCGNYGLLDQIAALRWVRRNIAAFGGDPDRVTIFGESAGAVSVGLLMVCPEAKGLFHRAIAESGGIRGVTRKLTEEWDGQLSLVEAGVRLSRELSCEDEEDPLAALRTKSVGEIMAAARPAPVSTRGVGKYGPAVDGWLLPDDPAKLWADGKLHDVPFLAGSTADDGSVFADRFPIWTARGYRRLARNYYEDDADAVLAMFPPDREGSVKDTFRKLLTISTFVASARSFMRDMERVESKGYLYHFTRVGRLASTFGVGAPHGAEIPYVFGTAPPWLGFDETDHKLADAMARYWIAFAATGNPNVEGLPTWPAYDRKTDRHLDLGDRIVSGKKLYQEECDLFDRINR